MSPLRCCLVALLFASAPAFAQPVSPAFKGDLPGWASLATPMKIDARGLTRPTPLWCREGLLTELPAFPVFEKVEQHGMPVFDPETSAWFVPAEGTLARVDGDRLTVVLEGLQGVDVDVRAARGLAVSREPDDTIVLWQLATGERRVLLTGWQYFRPRFSPDGQSVLVAESRATGGHFWLVTLDGRATDLGQGIGPAWHPDGRRLVFVRTTHDGHTVHASTVHVMDVATRRERLLARTSAPPLLAPAVSLDGRHVAFGAAGGDLVLVAPFADVAREGR